MMDLEEHFLQRILGRIVSIVNNGGWNIYRDTTKAAGLCP